MIVTGSTPVSEGALNCSATVQSYQSYFPSDYIYRGRFTPDGMTTIGRLPKPENGTQPDSDADSTTEPVERAKRGIKGISRHGRRDIRSGARIMQDERGKRCLSFFTGTLPTLPPEIHKIICESFYEVVRQFVQELRRLLVRKGLSPEVLGVIEIQTHRYKTYGIYAPHIHLILNTKHAPKQEWKVKPKELERLWENALSNVAGTAIKCPYGTKLQPIKKDIVRYLSKYLSKGNQGDYKDVPESYIPSAWHTMSRTLLDKIREQTIEFTGDFARCMFEMADVLQAMGLVVWHKSLEFVDNECYGVVLQFRSRDDFMRCLEIINAEFAP